MNVILPLLLILASCLIIWRSSDGFEVASDYLGRNFPPGIKGATINAIASSMPEFLTTLFFLFYLRDAEGFSGGLAVSSGSALFNLLIIPALAVILLFSVRKGLSVKLNKRVLLREGLFLLLSQLLFIAFLYNRDLLAWHGLTLVVVYIGYLFLLFVLTRRGGNSDPGFISPDPGRGRNVATRILTLDITRSVLQGGSLNRSRAWILLAISTTVMTAGTWLLVLGTEKFGEASGIPLVFVAVVLAAAATSVPDTIISIKDARKGNYDDAVSNALGSNIFDIAFALGLPILLYNLIASEPIALTEKFQDFTQEVWVFLLLATVMALGVMLAGKRFTRGKAWMLLGIYVVFLLFVGTQVSDRGFGGAGAPIKEFLTSVADWIGRIPPLAGGS